MYGINPDHMPDIIDCSDLVGGLTKKAADQGNGERLTDPDL